MVCGLLVALQHMGYSWSRDQIRSPALAGRFPTTGPLGKSEMTILKGDNISLYDSCLLSCVIRACLAQGLVPAHLLDYCLLSSVFLACSTEWFALETNRDHSVVFEIASKYCISDSLVDHDGYSISSEGFLPAIVDIMVI